MTSKSKVVAWSQLYPTEHNRDLNPYFRRQTRRWKTLSSALPHYKWTLVFSSKPRWQGSKGDSLYRTATSRSPCTKHPIRTMFHEPVDGEFHNTRLNTRKLNPKITWKLHQPNIGNTDKAMPRSQGTKLRKCGQDVNVWQSWFRFITYTKLLIFNE